MGDAVFINDGLIDNTGSIIINSAEGRFLRNTDEILNRSGSSFTINQE